MTKRALQLNWERDTTLSSKERPRNVSANLRLNKTPQCKSVVGLNCIMQKKTLDQKIFSAFKKSLVFISVVYLGCHTYAKLFSNQPQIVVRKGSFNSQLCKLLPSIKRNTFIRTWFIQSNFLQAIYGRYFQKASFSMHKVIERDNLKIKILELHNSIKQVNPPILLVLPSLSKSLDQPQTVASLLQAYRAGFRAVAIDLQPSHYQNGLQLIQSAIQTVKKQFSGADMYAMAFDFSADLLSAYSKSQKCNLKAIAMINPSLKSGQLPPCYKNFNFPGVAHRWFMEGVNAKYGLKGDSIKSVLPNQISCNGIFHTRIPTFLLFNNLENQSLDSLRQQVESHKELLLLTTKGGGLGQWISSGIKQRWGSRASVQFLQGWRKGHH